MVDCYWVTAPQKTVIKKIISSTSDLIFDHNPTSIASSNCTSPGIAAATPSRVAELQCSLTEGCLDEGKKKDHMTM